MPDGWRYRARWAVLCYSWELWGLNKWGSSDSILRVETDEPNLSKPAGNAGTHRKGRYETMLTYLPLRLYPRLWYLYHREDGLLRFYVPQTSHRNLDLLQSSSASEAPLLLNGFRYQAALSLTSRLGKLWGIADTTCLTLITKGKQSPTNKNKTASHDEVLRV